uniref:V-set and transmembrane domain-containing protein 2-like protein n=1 Tax=Ficedula albicollis TaxID=59894 RepID=A0A803VLC9_FICAL
VRGIFLCIVLHWDSAVSPQAPSAPALSPAALFTETPHDMTAQAGEDVEMACSFRGSGSPSYSLEIQWWYVRNHKDWTDKQTWASSQVMPLILLLHGRAPQVVKVVGSNISHKLRLSRVKLEDEGTYECRVIDSSDGKARHHKVKAYLRVEARLAPPPRPVQHPSASPSPAGRGGFVPSAGHSGAGLGAARSRSCQCHGRIAGAAPGARPCAHPAGPRVPGLVLPPRCRGLRCVPALCPAPTLPALPCASQTQPPVPVGCSV